MFCFQCEEVAKGSGCTNVGVCGKKPEVAALQDLLIYTLKGLALYAVEGHDVKDPEVDRSTCEALFATLTNVNFDPERFKSYIARSVSLRDALRKRVRAAGGAVELSEPPASFQPAEEMDELVKQGEAVGIKAEEEKLDPDLFSLQQTLIIALKGIAAYAYHAAKLGEEDEAVYAFLHEGLASTLNPRLGLDDWLELVLKAGEVNLRVMELLDAANTGTYGHPRPTRVPLGARAGKAILASGHDLKDLELVLKQTEGKGIYIYTHGEMLPAHGYPELKRYPHLYGHYGGAWHNQQGDFASFPGPILMTTNCLVPPKETYKDRLFTTGPVGYPGVRHIEGEDFSAVIEKALQIPGFERNEDRGSVVVGFAREAVLGVAPKVIEAVKEKAIRHFFLVGGCDGRKRQRSYYTELVEQITQDCVVLTLGCGKFRFFDEDLGTIGDIPRLLDVGQCNDAYSAIKIAQALAEAFGCNINDLPLSLILSWYEQKAVAILLTLLYLGIRDIRIGPSLPAFLSPGVLEVLVKNFALRPITNPQEDLKTIWVEKAR